MAALVAPIISGIGSLFGGLFGASSASKAAQQQVEAEKQAQGQLQQSEGQALGQQTSTTNANLSRLNPYLQAGTTASGNLSQMLGTPGQGLLTPWTNTFQAPTAEQAAATPGYQFQLQQGENALQNSAAARGGLLSGQTLSDMNNYAQGVASTNYQNQFNNAQTQYQSAYQTFLNNQQNAYGMLSGQQNTGLNAANQMGSLAQMGANNFGNITTGTGADIASLYNQQGAAKAAGTLGVGSSLSNMFGNMSNTAAQYGVLSQMNGTNPVPMNWNMGLGGSGYSPGTNPLPMSNLSMMNPSFNQMPMPSYVQ